MEVEQLDHDQSERERERREAKRIKRLRGDDSHVITTHDLDESW